MTTNDMTDDQIQRIFDNDKHSLILDDPFRIEKIMYGMFQINDTQMDFVTDLERELKNADIYHRNIKQKLKELRKLIHENHTKKLKDHTAWGNRSEEQLDAIASDNSVLTALARKFCGLSNKITFFGGMDASIGQKVWAVNPKCNRPMLVRIDWAQGVIDCKAGGENVGKILLHCTRLNEKVGSETKDKYVIDGVDMFYTKDEAQQRINKNKNKR